MLKNKTALTVLCIILFLTFLDNTIVSVVLYGIQNDLRTSIQGLQWIVDGYMLVFAAFMLTGGNLGDILGRKKIMLSGVLVFCLGSLVSMIASSTDILIAGRVIMGVGAAASEPGTLSLIRHIYPNSRARNKALGIWTAVSAGALAFGPIIGGLIASASSWRYIFAFNLIIGLIIFIIGMKTLPESVNSIKPKIDLFGLLLGFLALTTFIFGVILGENNGYQVWWVDLLFGISFLLLITFLYWEKRQEYPVLNLKYFKIPAYSGANFIAFATNFGVFAIFFFTALYLAIVAGFSGYKIALAFLSMAASMIIGSLLTSRWLHKLKPLLPPLIGSLISGTGLLICSFILKPNVSEFELAWSLPIIGLGFGITLVSITSLVLGLVPPNRSGMAAATFNTFRELGGVFGVAILGSLVNGQLSSQLIIKLKALGLPFDFQQLTIYAITHGGNLPQNAHISASEILNHPELVQQVTNASFQAFGSGLQISLRLASMIILIAGIVAILSMYKHLAELNKL